MRTYKDSRGDLKEIQKDSELKVQRNLWKIREDPGEIQIDCGKILKILNREIQRDLLKILGAIRGIIGEDLELQDTNRLWEHRDRERGEIQENAEGEVQRDSWKIQGDLEKIQEDLSDRGIMKTYKES
jgi:hypothetical protein